MYLIHNTIVKICYVGLLCVTIYSIILGFMRNPAECSYSVLKFRRIKSTDDITPSSQYDSEEDTTLKQYNPMNVFFMRIHKTGSTNVHHILCKYAWKHELRVATYKGDPSLLPLKAIVPQFTPGKSQMFNFSLHHVRYSRQIQSFLQAPIKYITLLRDPVSWLESYLQFNNFVKKYNLNKSDASLSFLHQVKVNPIWKANRTINNARNWATKFFSRRYMHDMTYERVLGLKDLFFVGITEYFDESLVLMRRFVGLSFQDMVYASQRVGTYKRPDPETSANYKKRRQAVCEYMNSDCLLYEMFNSTFWMKYNREGQGVKDEVKHFRMVLARVKPFCQAFYNAVNAQDKKKGIELDNIPKPLHFQPSEWHPFFTYSATDCALAAFNDRVYRNMFYFRQNPHLDCPDTCPIDIERHLCKKICFFIRANEDVVEGILREKDAYILKYG